MRTKASIKGHPIHAMLVVLPLGLFLGGLLALLGHAATLDPFWYRAAYSSMLAGVGFALLAAVFGVIDLVGVRRDARAKEIGVFHAGTAITTTALFGAAGLMMRNEWWSTAGHLAPRFALALGLAVLGASLAVVTGVLGWHLVGIHHVGVSGQKTST